MFGLDKSAFKKQSFIEAKNQVNYWLSKSPDERLHTALYLQSIAFGFDFSNPPRMLKGRCHKRKRE